MSDLNIDYAKHFARQIALRCGNLTAMYELPREMQRRHEINDLVSWHGLVTVERVLEVHRTTIQRWLNGKVPVPIVAILALRALKGDFPHMEAAKHWHGWRFGRDGTLFEPNNTPHTATEISGIYWKDNLIRSLQEQVKKLEEMLDAGNIQHRVVITANDTFEDHTHPVAQMKEEIYQLKRRPRGRSR